MKTLTKPYDLFDLINLNLDSNLENKFFPSIFTNKKIYSNIKELDDEVILELLVPGFKKNELEITLENNNLLVKAKKETKSEKNEEKLILNEYSFNEFSRNFKINPDFDTDLVNSKLEDGILTIKIPKLKKSDSKKVILIK